MLPLQSWQRRLRGSSDMSSPHTHSLSHSSSSPSLRYCALGQLRPCVALLPWFCPHPSLITFSLLPRPLVPCCPMLSPRYRVLRPQPSGQGIAIMAPSQMHGHDSAYRTHSVSLVLLALLPDTSMSLPAIHTLRILPITSLCIVGPDRPRPANAPRSQSWSENCSKVEPVATQPPSLPFYRADPTLSGNPHHRPWKLRWQWKNISDEKSIARSTCLFELTCLLFFTILVLCVCGVLCMLCFLLFEIRKNSNGCFSV